MFKGVKISQDTKEELEPDFLCSTDYDFIATQEVIYFTTYIYPELTMSRYLTRSFIPLW
jgi:hypothetical protein